MTDTFESYDARFQALLHPDSQLERLWTGGVWVEGPVYIPTEDAVLWSDIPNNRMLRYRDGEGVSIFRQPSHFTNGNTLDREGRLVSCQQGTRRIARTEADGTVVTVVDNYQGKRLNSPNDVIVKSDGTIWFSDPPYGILPDTREGYPAESELGGCYVFRYDPATDTLTIAADGFDKPNGLAFSPDGKRLYVSDTGRSHDPDGNHHIRVFDVRDDATLHNDRIFAVIDPGLSDGFRFDENGYLFTSAGDGVQVFTEAGDMIGKIRVPEVVSNVTFGGHDGNRMFITATTSLYAVTLNTRGAVRP